MSELQFRDCLERAKRGPHDDCDVALLWADKRIAELEAENQRLERKVDQFRMALLNVEASRDALREALHNIYGKACQAMDSDDDLYLYGFARDARDIALNAHKAALEK